ncbi:MerR family transcriptional regulator [Clostridium sardiniense]
MSEKKEKYLTISEFGRLCGVTRKTLIFYDKEGVFSPSYRDKNGYRYYSLKQYDTFNLILDLRKIGVTLEDIKLYLDERAPEKCIDLLQEENKKIQKKIEELNLISKVINNKIKLTKEGIEEINNLDVSIEEREEEYMLYSRIESNNQKDLMKDLTNFVNYCNEEGIDYGYSIGATVSKESILNKKFTACDKFFVNVSDEYKKYKEARLLIKPKGLYAIINHRGDYYCTDKSYEKLLEYIDANEYRICGESYENSLLDYFSIKDEKDYLTEISIRVEKK